MAFFSSKDLPNVRPVADFNFAATKILDNRINFSRGSVGTYIDNMGIVRYAPHNVPRFDHAPTTGESLGLLIEESRTNMVEYSDFTTGWNEYGGTATSTTETTAPDGTFTAKKITSKGDQSTSGMYDSINYTANTTYTHTMWLKAGSVTIAGITVLSAGNWASSNYPYITVNLSTGAVTASGGVSAKATAYPNGWYRLEATGTKSSSTGVDSIWVHSQTGSSMSGNTTDYYYVWGPQAEQGNFGTSYIPSSQGNGTTRGADLATIKGTNFTDFYNQNEGTLFGEFTIKDTAYSSAAIANINQEPGSSYANSIMFVEVGTANGYFGRTYKSSSGISISNGSSILNSLHPSTTPQTVSFGYTTATGGTLAAYWNGNSVNSSSDLSKVPTTLTNMRIGRGWTGNDPINAHIKKISYYNKRLSNAQLQGLTQQ